MNEKKKILKFPKLVAKDDYAMTENEFMKISKKSNVILNIIMALTALSCILPYAFVVILSFTSESDIEKYGYSFLPKHVDVKAYKYIIDFGGQISSAYGVTLFVTIVGTILGVLFVSTYAYTLSRKNFAFRRFFTLLAFVPMLFGGGLVSFYLVVVNMLHMKNSMWALILPMCMNTWYIMVLRTFYKTTVSDSIIESAKLDGASEMRLFFQIVFPISLPGVATIALFFSLGYWNDWFNAMLFIDNDKLVPLQYFLIRIQNSSEFLTRNVMALGSNYADAMRSLPKESSRMAAVVLATAPIILAYPFFQRFFISGLTIGGVKE